MDNVDIAEYHLYDNEWEGLSCDEFKYISSLFNLYCEVQSWDEQIEKIVKHNGSHDNEHSPLGVSIREAEFWQLVHY